MNDTFSSNRTIVKVFTKLSNDTPHHSGSWRPPFSPSTLVLPAKYQADQVHRPLLEPERHLSGRNQHSNYYSNLDPNVLSLSNLQPAVVAECVDSEHPPSASVKAILTWIYSLKRTANNVRCTSCHLYRRTTTRADSRAC